ncbi:MAG: hypothetical protein GXO32_04705 [Crenarchaeota archaeon]|nr:hypothetical protein [Thermoproteota archaeon]
MIIPKPLEIWIGSKDGCIAVRIVTPMGIEFYRIKCAEGEYEEVSSPVPQPPRERAAETVELRDRK